MVADLSDCVYSADNHEVVSGDGEPKLVENLLGRLQAAEAIAEIVRTIEPPFTIGVYGDWGSGKTYFLKQIRDELIRAGSQDRAGAPAPVTIFFEAWRHQNENNPIISMLGCAFDALPEKAQGTGAKEKLWATLLTIADNLPDVEIALPGVVKLKASPANIRKSFRELTSSDQKKRIAEKTEQIKLREQFDDLLRDIACHGANSEGEASSHRVVFFIDDLDRCLPEQVVELLEKIKLFLWNPNCVFIIGVDSVQVEKSIDEAKGYKDPAIAHRYLEKIINFPFQLPPLSAGDCKTFISAKLYNMEADDAADQDSVSLELLTIASDEAHASLRLMIQVANAFILNDALLRKEMGKEVEGSSQGNAYRRDVTAAVTALMMLWPNVLKPMISTFDEREKKLKAFFDIGTNKDAVGAAGEEQEKAPAAGGVGEEQDKARGAGVEAGWEQILGNELAGIIKKDLYHFMSYARGNLNLPGDFNILPYVEFLVPATAVERAETGENRDGAANENGRDDNEGMLWAWFKKNPSFKEHLRGNGSIQAAVAYINANNMKKDDPLLVAIDGYSWRVLATAEARALLVTEHVIGKGPLTLSQTYQFKWSECDLKKELNSPSWQSRHLPALSAGAWITNPPQGYWNSGEDGEIGKELFLLSLADVREKNLLKGNTAARDLSGSRAWWWLRSPGDHQVGAADVNGDGSVYEDGSDVGSGDGGVRPAFWLNLNA